jgi:stage II sporulation protein P
MSRANNPHYNKNIALVNSLINIANKDFKGILCDQNLYIYEHGSNSFNQSLSNNAFLIEVGCDQNELSEAKATAKYLARIFAEQINGKK